MRRAGGLINVVKPSGEHETLLVDHVDLPSGALIGMTHCPGRRLIDASGAITQRRLANDLAAIETWGACVVVTLVERHEFARLGVPDLDLTMQSARFDWHHVPIADMQPPDARSLTAWSRAEPSVSAALNEGKRVIFHCAAGLGRTGMIAAKLLVETGMAPADAIELVRSIRPGAIETPAQEAFVRDRQPFAPSILKV